MAGITGRHFERVASVIGVGGGKWRKDVQARDWVGKAVAQVLNLDVGNKADKAKIKGILKVWFGSGSLKIVEGLDGKRMPKDFVEVANEN